MSDLMSGALELSWLGIGVVFAFLSLLVVATTAMSAIVRRLAPVPPPVSTPGKPRTEPDPHLRQAIRLAIAEHRKRHG